MYFAITPDGSILEYFDEMTDLSPAHVRVSRPLSLLGIKPCSSRVFDDKENNRIIIENTIYTHQTNLTKKEIDFLEFDLY